MKALYVRVILNFLISDMLTDGGETTGKPLVVQLCLLEKSVTSANSHTLHFFRAL